MIVSVKTSGVEREYFIKGEFSLQDKDRFFDVFVQIRSMTERVLVFNLSKCVSVDTAAMGMLVVACEEAAKRNIERVIRFAPEPVKEMLFSAGLGKFYHFQ